MPLYDPRGHANRALIVGVSEYDHTGPPDGVPGNLPTVQENRTMLDDALHRSALFAEGQIAVCPSPTLDGFHDALRRAAHDAEGLLLFYFAGHGILPVDGNELSLQMRTARMVPGGAFPGAVAITTVLNELAGSPAARIVVILDCCYAGNAARAWQEMESHKRSKILLLMSVQSNRLIRPSDGGRGTPFTRELVRLLQQQRELTLLALYRELREHLQILTVARDWQEPQGAMEPGEDVLLRSGALRVDPPWIPLDDGAKQGKTTLRSVLTRRRVAVASITCLALAAAATVGVRLIGDDGDGGDPPPPNPSASPRPSTSSRPTASSSPSVPFSPAAPSPVDAEKNKRSLARLKAAQEGTGEWVVGVKRGQPGLSEQKGGGWVGKEIDYAKVILDELGVKKFRFQGVGTASRAQALNDDEVDMFVGTYGISPDRKEGTSEYPAVIFAGPYFRTAQKIMLEHYPGSGDPIEARIRGLRRRVTSIFDIPNNARLCVVKGSSAEEYLQQDKARQRYVEHRTDYNLCIDGLDDTFDAVLTDEVILQNFKEGGKYFIAADPFTYPEEYGIGLNVNSVGARDKICDAMSATAAKRDSIYKSLGGEHYSPPAPDECPPKP
ncbi:caspase family protein [Streptomyces sp. NPDC093225]|uniref:caspase family protein n=1 Tax=Streptomyces sp. NPDC093225 TaxID=3366034 RepID=UPI0037F66C3C